MNSGSREAEGRDADAMVSLEFELPAPPDKVWRALADPKILASWVEPDGREADDRPSVSYDLIDAEPGRRVSYRWREGTGLDSIVTFAIAENSMGGTRLTIVQTEAALAPVKVAGPLACRLSFGASCLPPSAGPGPTANLDGVALCRLAA